MKKKFKQYNVETALGHNLFRIFLIDPFVLFYVEIKSTENPPLEIRILASVLIEYHTEQYTLSAHLLLNRIMYM